MKKLSIFLVTVAVSLPVSAQISGIASYLLSRRSTIAARPAANTGVFGWWFVTDDADCDPNTADDGIAPCYDNGDEWVLGVGSGGGGAPSSHANTHQDGGSDEINVAGLVGLLATAQTPAAHTQAASTISDSTAAGRSLLTAADEAAQRTALGLGTAATKDVPASGDAAAGEVVKGDDSRLTDARAPLTHAHAAGDTTSGIFADARVDGSAEADELVVAGDVDGTANSNDLDESAVESELEAVLDLADQQGQITDAQIADGAVDGGTGGEIADASVTAADLGADSVAASELDASAVESELEALLDLQDQQGAVTDAQVPNTITVDLATTATTAAAFDHNPTACAASNFATDQDAAGALTCAQPSFADLSGAATDAQVPDTITASNYAPLAGATFTGPVAIDNAQGFKLFEADANGSNYFQLTVAASLTGDTTCTIGADGKIPDSCVGDGTDGGGSGDVVGPSSATDECFARFDTTTGKLVQNSVVCATDAGVLNGSTQLNVDNLRMDGSTFSSTSGALTISSASTLTIISASGQSIQFNPAGVSRWGMQGSTGHLVANTDNSVDIGASGATRPRNVYVAGWVVQSGGRASLAANGTNATATLATTGLSMTLTTGRKYSFTCSLEVNNSVAGEGVQIDFNGGTATATDFWARVNITDTALLKSQRVTALNTAVSVATATGDTQLEISGSFEASGTGTFIPRYAENSHATGTLTIYRGSWCLAQDMP